MSPSIDFPDADAAVVRAVDYVDLNRLAAAERVLRDALAVWPNDRGLLRQLALVLDERMRCDELLTVTRAALSRWPEDPELLHRHGRALEYLGRNEEALAALEEGLRLDPHHGFMLRDYGEFLTYARRHDEAVAVLERAVEQFPQDADLLCRLAHCHNRMGNNHRADELLAAALELDPYDPITWYAAADNHWALGRSRASIAAYMECVRLEPDHANAVSMARHSMVWPIATVYISLRWSLPVAAIMAMVGAWTGGSGWSLAALATVVVAAGYAAHWTFRGGVVAWRAFTASLPVVRVLVGVGIATAVAGLAATAVAATGGGVGSGAVGLVAGLGLWLLLGIDTVVGVDPHAASGSIVRRMATGMWHSIRNDLTVGLRTAWRRLSGPRR